METNTFANFLAICGGLLGLFLGITALSILEIVYYLSLRIFWIVRNLRAQNCVVPIDMDIAGPSNVESNFTHSLRSTLFLGMSALSVVEIIYYFTLRLFWTFRRLKSEFNVESQITSETDYALSLQSLQSNLRL